MLVFNLLENRL